MQLEYLEELFDRSLETEPWSPPESLPLILQQNYEYVLAQLDGHPALFLHPKDSLPLPRISVLAKHCREVQKRSGLLCALYLDTINTSQRRYLLSGRVPFLAAWNQVFLPFWGMSLQEKAVSAPDRGSLSPGSQMVFLYFYYAEEGELCSISRLSQQLGLSKATCTRAVRELEEEGLLESSASGPSKIARRRLPAEIYLQQGFDLLKSPVERVMYGAVPLVDGLACGLPLLEALCGFPFTRSGQSSAQALYKKSTHLSQFSQMLSRREYQEKGGTRYEIWTYDPRLFAQEGHVDPISLLLSLDETEDENVQQALDLLRKQYGLTSVLLDQADQDDQEDHEEIVRQTGIDETAQTKTESL